MRTLALILLTLLPLCATAQAQAKKGPPKLYKGKPLRYWLDRAFVENPETERSYTIPAIRALDPKGKTVKKLCYRMLSKGNDFEKVAGANVLFRVYSDSEFSVKPLIGVVKTGKKHKGRAMIVLARIGEAAKESIPMIGKIAAGKTAEKSAALDSLERFGALAKSQQPIVEAVLADAKADSEDRLVAARAHWKMSQDESKLLAYLKTCLGDADLSQLVNKSLEELGEKALPIWDDALKTVPEGPMATFRFYAIEKLGEKSLVHLAKIIKEDRPARLQKEAVLCLGRLATNRRKPCDKAIPLLIRGLDLKGEKAVHFAAVFLARLGKKAKDALAKLDGLSSSSNEKIKSSARDAAAKIRKALGE